MKGVAGRTYGPIHPSIWACPSVCKLTPPSQIALANSTSRLIPRRERHGRTKNRPKPLPCLCWRAPWQARWPGCLDAKSNDAKSNHERQVLAPAPPRPPIHGPSSRLVRNTTWDPIGVTKRSGPALPAPSARTASQAFPPRAPGRCGEPTRWRPHPDPLRKMAVLIRSS